MKLWLRLHWPLVGLLIIAASSVVWPLPGGWLTRLALGWDVGVALFLIESAAKVMRARTTNDIRSRAAAMDEAGRAILPLALIAALASVVVVIGEAAGGAGDRTSAILALSTVALSWVFIHVIFAFHYAHAFYAPVKGGDAGGLLFPGEEAPDYWDFLHFALIIGVASQTADVQIASKALRRTSTVHSVTAFVFNTVIVALSVNLAVGLLGAG
ncbi:putative membrane protein [Brevundimonas alba]|uniref:Putative membrane protein n=1 Tax=Brevundimonas alba TaxID=74314 RepID=A0A7X5YK42_9CAUL|nr:DUF1345 domain-containing protein [Brevundimonas alba]NJC41403.1 putative membrane protein [Brevundimonas alba]